MPVEGQRGAAHGEQSDYGAWFQQVTGHVPHPWQQRLGNNLEPDSRVLRIPTGLGKTCGVLGAWMWNRLVRRDPAWPRRLVWALPMRVLVEQTLGVVRAALDAGGFDDVSVVPMLGGEADDRWHLRPEAEAVLVGTQDMLLSRALNRGYGAPRARWPMEFALLHTDALWVLDEVQLMDVGLTTSSQLQSFRGAPPRDATTWRPTHSWWMSATLRPEWLLTVDSSAEVQQSSTRVCVIPPEERAGPAFEATKSLCVAATPAKAADAAQAIADLALASHAADRTSLVIVNTVSLARQVHAKLAKHCAQTEIDLRLVHSRFRPCDRRAWRDDFLRPDAAVPSAGRIIVSTQVVEAGVDLSADLLVTELAPWASLVQRFGRAARFGGQAEIVVVDRGLEGKDLLPYDPEQIVAARGLLTELQTADLASLDDIEQRLRATEPARAELLFHHQPAHVLTELEFVDLFDTTPDLTGADLDIGRFIRTGDDRDLGIAWIDLDGDSAPDPNLHPARDAVCPVAIAEAREWLFKVKTPPTAFAWDFLTGTWRRARREDCRPGAVLAVSAAAGGYDPQLGFTGDPPKRGQRVVVAPAAALGRESLADYGHAFDEVSVQAFKTIATHGRETAEQVGEFAGDLDLPPRTVELLDLAARLHDWGKAHPVFQAAIRREDPARPPRDDLAKAPQTAWHALRGIYDHDPTSGRRRGFRHELASALACFELLRGHAPDHPAFAGADATPVETHDSNLLAAELAALSAGEFDLVAYLVAAHHGKVRGRLHAAPQDQQGRSGGTTLPIRGVADGDLLPATDLAASPGEPAATPAVALSLEPAAIGLSPRYGRSWTERVLELVDRHGPIELAWLETLLRVADVRASRLQTDDPLLETAR